MKLFYAGKTIMGYIADLEANKFYKFDAAPMPYDIIIKAKHAGTMDVEYSLVAVPKQDPLTPSELEELKAKKPIDEVVSKLMEKQAGAEDNEQTIQHGA